MKNFWKIVSVFIFATFLSVSLCSCGGSPTRYNPGPAATPSNLAVAGASGGQVLLTWPKADNAGGYNVYFSTSSGFTPSAGTLFATTKSTSISVTGLSPSTTYYFLVTSVNSSGETAASNEVFATTPADNTPFVQTDLVSDSQGNLLTWNFNILVSGTSAGWMRGNISVDANGDVTFNSFLDNSGGTTPPASLFPTLLVDSGGQVLDNSSVKSAKFHGVMSTRRNMIVGTSSLDAASPMFIILQKHSPLVTFSDAGDIKGFGKTAGGSRRFAYNQISSGSTQEWEFAEGQIGQDMSIQYSTFTIPSGPTTPPGNKATTLSVNSDGIVKETGGSGTPQPSVLITAGNMSDDKSVIVTVATDNSGSSPKYILRIYQMENIVSGDPNTFSLSDLTGTYGLQQLVVDTSTLWASGVMSVNSSGSAVFSAFTDSNGNSASPAGISMGITTDGILSNAADTTFNGKLSYFKDMLVFTRTESSGAYGLSIGLR
jgi:hypothetical protein